MTSLLTAVKWLTDKIQSIMLQNLHLSFSKLFLRLPIVLNIVLKIIPKIVTKHLLCQNYCSVIDTSLL